MYMCVYVVICNDENMSKKKVVSAKVVCAKLTSQSIYEKQRTRIVVLYI